MPTVPLSAVSGIPQGYPLVLFFRNPFRNPSKYFFQQFLLEFFLGVTSKAPPEFYKFLHRLLQKLLQGFCPGIRTESFGDFF